MANGVTIVLFVTIVIIVCFVVHIICQNHKFHKEQMISAEKISRLFDHLVVRRARQAKTSSEWLEAFTQNCTARGAFEALERIYDGTNPSLAEVIGVQLDVVSDNLIKQEDFLRESVPKMEE